MRELRATRGDEGVAFFALVSGKLPEPPPLPDGVVSLVLRSESGERRRGDPGLSVDGLYADAEVFVQAAAETNAMLQDAVLAALGDAERVLELFAGVGNLSVPIAAVAQELWAVEKAEGAAMWLERNLR